MNGLPLSPLVLIALAVAVLAVASAVSVLVDDVTTIVWPMTEGPASGDDRGRDTQLEHLVRLLHASSMEDAHRTVSGLVQQRLATTWAVEPGDAAGARAVLGPQLDDFLRHPPTHTPEAYLTALTAALDRIERL
jgi:hypothetical protein